MPAAQRPQKVGIYRSWKEFVDNRPSSTDSFVVEPFYLLWEPPNANGRLDSLRAGFQFLMAGPVHKPNPVWGLYDGTTVYKTQHVNQGGEEAGLTQNLIPFAASGRSPYMILRKYRDFTFLLIVAPLAPAVIATSALQNNNIYDDLLYFIDERGHFVRCTQDRLRIMLKKDKELYKTFIKEKRFNDTIGVLYLQQYNERNPL